MNCKPGDLAIVVRSATGRNTGHLVTCLRLSAHPGLLKANGELDLSPVWETDHWSAAAVSGEVHNLWCDSDLRPIRDPGEDARDESLSWKPVPTELPERIRA